MAEETASAAPVTISVTAALTVNLMLLRLFGEGRTAPLKLRIVGITY